MQACDQCHERKVRCDKAVPCRRCRQTGAQCHYTDRTKSRTYSHSHVNLLEKRIKRLEAQNRVLAQQSRESSHPTASQTATQQGQLHGSAGDVNHGQHSQVWSADVAREVSYLSINASGERQYLGSSSGVLLANFIKANVEIETSTRPTTPPREHDTSHEGDSAPDLGRDLPSESVARRLLLSYLNHSHICYPAVHPAMLLALLAEMYGPSSTTFYSQHPFESFVFDIVLAIATSSICRSDLQGIPSAQSHYARAMTRVSSALEMGGLNALQAIILLIQYRNSSSMQDTSASMWHLVGIGTRIALELGLHRESAYPRKLQELDRVIEDDDATALIKQEVSRLCFWSIVSMDRIVSNILGRPLAIRGADIDASLPREATAALLLRNLPQAITEQILTKSRIAIFVHITKYRMLCGDIIDTLHARSHTSWSDVEIREKRDHFTTSLDHWREDAMSVSSSLESQGISHSSCFTSPTWYKMIYHNAMLMLYRPSPTLDISRDAVAVQTIFSSAKDSISSYASLHRTGILNHSWLTLQALFMAGLSYVYAVTMHCQVRHRYHGHAQGRLLCKDPSMLEVINDTRTCSNVLVAVSERWKSLQRCVDVFNRLSDAILSDVIKFASNSTQSLGPGPRTRGVSPMQQESRSELERPAHAPQAMPDDQTVGQSMAWEPATTYDQSLHAQQMQPNYSPLAIENEFRDSAFDLQQMYSQQQVDMSVYQFSQLWFDSFDQPIL